ncbi:hypothetical protein AB0I81_23935 [Nonomuraea sp. NPDC050404]|uniref:hypothetical protein n=1 Tax=Nonomuraea sp. NPDC050404 TaxID=3155783 RepID=UPI0033FAEFCF
MADTFKFRIDHHGSLVRPPELLAARRQHEEGTLGADGLRAVEDRAIADVVKAQRRLNLSVVTDGEFRREDVRSAVFDRVAGFRRAGSGWAADGELKADGPLIAEEVAAVAAQTWIAAKATLPSPAYLAGRCFAEGTSYKSARELGDALAEIIRAEIELLIFRGIRYIQLDNPDYAAHLLGGADAALSLDDAIAVDTRAVGLPDKPDNVRVGLCPVRAADGQVDEGVAARLFERVPVDRWILPYCAGTQAETRLLRAVPADRDVCLGVVDPDRPELEDIDVIMDRMDAVAGLRDIEDVAVSPRAGFSEVAGRAALGFEEQRRKLTHVETIARMCWGNEL